MTDASPTPRTARLKAYLGLLYIALCTLGILYAPQPLLNAMRADLGTSEATTGLLISVSLLPLAVAPLFYGALLGRVATRTLLILAVCLLGLSGVLLYAAPSFATLLAVRFGQGLIFPAVFTAIMAHISNKFEKAELQRAMAVYIGATILGGVIGRVCGGLMASLWGWRTALLVVNLSILAGLPILFGLRAEVRARVVRHRLSEFIAVLREPGVGSLMLIEGCTFFAFVAIGNLLPFRMAQIGAGGSEFRIGLMYSGYAIGVATALCSRRLIALCGGETRLLMAGLSIYCLALFGFLVPSVTVMFVTMWLLCLGQFTEHTNAPGLINRLTSKDKGMVNGLYLAFYYSGGALGSYVPGLIYDAFGWTVCVLSLEFLLVGVLLLCVHLHRGIPALLK